MARQAHYSWTAAAALSSRQELFSVIIPVLNEAPTVESVIQFALESPWVGEVIVVDDGSIDGTPEKAERAGARVVTSTMLGKGGSMEDGVRIASYDNLLYLDGDLTGLEPDLISRMAEPLQSNKADFVKARFTRDAGRVTVLTARPLLRTYFPEAAGFEQPLGGIIAARRSLLERLEFESDYGVDVGLLIDVLMRKARVVEVDVGQIEHDSQPLKQLEEMAVQVARTILHRARCYGRLRPSFAHRVRETERFQRAELSATVAQILPSAKLALFDMDGVLVNGRFVVELARRTGQESKLAQFLDREDLCAQERSSKIAALFTGVPCNVFELCAKEMPLTVGAVEAVVGLRKAGFRVGILTDSYDTAAEIIRRRVFADFSVANLMSFRNGIATGRLTPAPAMRHPLGCLTHKYCKANALLHFVERLGIETARVLAVGDGDNDVCMLQKAGCSIAFQPKTARVRKAAMHLLSGTLSGVLEVIKGSPMLHLSQTLAGSATEFELA